MSTIWNIDDGVVVPIPTLPLKLVIPVLVNAFALSKYAMLDIPSKSVDVK